MKHEISGFISIGIVALIIISAVVGGLTTMFPLAQRIANLEAQLSVNLGAASTTLTDTINTFRLNVNSIADELNAVSSSVRNITISATSGITGLIDTQILFGKLGGAATSSRDFTFSSSTSYLSVNGVVSSTEMRSTSSTITNATITNTSGTNITASGYIQVTGNNLFDAGGNKYTTSTAAASSLTIFTASTTWTVPAGVTLIFVSGIGPGGGGGGATAGGAGGGGSGAFVFRIPTSTTPGENIVVTLGNPGQGAVTDAAGGAGTATTVGSWLTLRGGNAGPGGTGGGAAGGAPTSTIIAGTTFTSYSVGGSAGAANAGGAGATFTTSTWMCIGGAGGPSGGGSGATSTVGYGCGGGGAGTVGPLKGGGSGGPSIVMFEY